MSRLEKHLSYLLRHSKDEIEIDKNGWVDIDEILEKVNIPVDTLYAVVKNSSKKRFSINEDNTKIRANQGHSIDVDVELREMTPPKKLYHGTAKRFLESILKDGLLPMKRQHVHLSEDTNTASNVGARHGSVIIFEIDCHQMTSDGHKFFLSENNVWLTEKIPLKYIRIKR